MPYTQLSPSATPGQPYSFPGSGSHTGGPFTQLSVIGVPGQRYSFSAKDPAVLPVVPSAPSGLPGAPGGVQGWPFPGKPPVTHRDKKWYKEKVKRARIMKDDNELMELIAAALMSGVFDE